MIKKKLRYYKELWQLNLWRKEVTTVYIFKMLTINNGKWPKYSLKRAYAVNNQINITKVCVCEDNIEWVMK